MPNMKLCPNGHYFDSEQYIACPYCKSAEAGPTMPADEDGFAESYPPPVGPTEPADFPGANVGYGGVGKTVGMDNDETVSLEMLKDTRIAPVVGWLVCTAGNDKGRDFRLHAGNNFVGRSRDRDVCLDDQSVSRKHFSVSYDRRKNRYFIAMGEGREIVYVNDEPIAGVTPLKKGDLIEVANTKLAFIPLEKEYVQWE